MRVAYRVCDMEFMRLDKVLKVEARLETRIKSAFWSGGLGSAQDMQRYEIDFLRFFNSSLPVTVRPLFWSNNP